MANEIWLPVLNGRYEVSNLGRLRNIYRKRKITPARLLLNGYRAIDTRAEGTILVHRLVAQTFLGPGPHACHWCGAKGKWAAGNGKARPGLRVDHLDGDKANNTVANLAPACNRCNTSRGRDDLIMPGELAVRSSTTHTRMTRAEERTCEQCGATFLHKIAVRAPGKGRFCSKSCSNKWRWQNGKAIGPQRAMLLVPAGRGAAGSGRSGGGPPSRG